MADAAVSKQEWRLMAAPEAVRLVIWDLDETLWEGTLTEGGIRRHVPENYAIIRELAQRGIMSSICSKNDFAPVRDILVTQDVWDYMIFPSIDWTQKGPRLRRIVEDVQLRPETILFIDDNPGNRADAQRSVPGIQVADERIIPSMLQDKRFAGKYDHGLTRLQQYKVLEQKHVDREASGSDARGFLLASDIRVRFEFELEPHLDRAIELINRTNQLNYTKKRLPEDNAAARRELLQEIQVFNRQAALIHVTDRYGDYGYVGFYCLQSSGTGKTLRHFCFSCRTLGMEVERYVYEKLGKPKIRIDGAVLTELNQPDPVDWIGVGEDVAGSTAQAADLGEIRIRGGCEMDPLVHYFNMYSKRIVSETNFTREHLFVRRNASVQIPGPGLNPQRDMPELEKLGFRAADLKTCLFNQAVGRRVTIILSLWADRSFPHYRHKRLGFRIACNLIHGQTKNLTELTPEQIENSFGEGGFKSDHRAKVLNYIRVIQDDYTYLGRLPPEEIERQTRQVFDHLPAQAQVFFIVPSAFGFAPSGRTALSYATGYEPMIGRLEQDYAHIEFVRMDDVIASDADRLFGNDHFKRPVYYALFKHLLARMQYVQAQAAA